MKCTVCILMYVAGRTAARTAVLFAKYIKKKYTKEISLDDLEEM